MLIGPEDDDAMDADADDEDDDEDDDYIPDAGGKVGTSSQVCGNGRQAVVPRGRASGRDRASGRARGRGRGMAQAGVPVQGGDQTWKSYGDPDVGNDIPAFEPTRPPGVHFDQPTLRRTMTAASEFFF